VHSFGDFVSIKRWLFGYLFFGSDFDLNKKTQLFYLRSKEILLAN
jgi:hypothetical protein